MIREADGMIGQIGDVASVDLDFSGDRVPEVWMLEKADRAVAPEGAAVSSSETNRETRLESSYD